MSYEIEEITERLLGFYVKEVTERRYYEMYRNAKAEMVRAGLTLERVSEALGCTTGTLSLWLNGKYAITLTNAKRFKEIVGSDMPLEELFKKFEEAD